MADAWRCDICNKIFIEGDPCYFEKKLIKIEFNISFDDYICYEVCDDCNSKMQKGIVSLIESIRGC